MGDIPHIDAAGTGGMTSAGAIIHETVEQFEKAKDGFKPGEGTGESFLKGHKKAIKVEDKVNGNIRDEMIDTDFTEKDGSTTSMFFHEESNGLYVRKTPHPKL